MIQRLIKEFGPGIVFCIGIVAAMFIIVFADNNISSQAATGQNKKSYSFKPPFPGYTIHAFCDMKSGNLLYAGVEDATGKMQTLDVDPSGCENR